MPQQREVAEVVRKLREGVEVPASSLDALATFLERYQQVTIGPAPEAGQWPAGWVAADQAHGEFARAFNDATGS